VGAGAATAAPSIEDVATGADGLTVPVTEPSIELLPSIDPTSDVELVFKTLYTTYTYFTTFFRESTSKVKSREEVISNVVTLTNILKPTDIPAVSISCELDSSCIFHSTDILSLPPAGFTDGFIGRPNTGPAELPRNGEGVPIPDANFEDDVSISSSISPAESHGDSSSILRTFYITYTYFSTLFVDGTSSVSTRTEVYSNIQSPDGQLSQQTADTEPFLHATSSSFISNSPSQVPSVDSSLEESTSAASSVQSLSGRRLETSSLGVAQLQSELITTQVTAAVGTEADGERPSTDRVPRLISSTEKQAAEDSGLFTETDRSTVGTTTESAGITPTPAIAISTNSPVEEEKESEASDLTFTKETPALTEEVTEVITSATTENLQQAAEVSPAGVVADFAPRTLYTTFTYFTTLFKDGTSTVTSNLETITNVMTDSNIQLTSV